MVQPTDRRKQFDSLAAAAVIVAAVGIWSKLVADIVPEPYLLKDEVFHVRQAAEYVKGNWRVWDPKITTPPGLYLVSYTQIWVFQFKDIVDTKYFRFTSAIGCICLVDTICSLLVLLRSQEAERGAEQSQEQWLCPTLIHNTVNICLFPPLFFFYGLYYTDVLSALSVLYAYHRYLKRSSGFTALSAGLSSLLFRQTNIFWVSLFIGGLAFCESVPKGRPGVGFAGKPSFYDVAKASRQHGTAYDPLISEANFEDYLKSGASFAIAGLLNLQTVLWDLSPYLVILASFCGFVIWNGGVVLGDKANHIATIHLAQMLYIWPYILFFSIPLLYPYLLNLLIPQTYIPPPLRSPTIKQYTPRPIILVPLLATILAIIHYNTIVHPFTLADNRHYTFYVFRILLRHPLIKYLAAPIYLLCAWAAIAALAHHHPQPLNPPPTPTPTPSQQPIKTQQRTPRVPPPSSNPNQRTSFLLLYLLATSASVITAPLVEPRYFIVPWLIWRLHVTDLQPTITDLQPPTTPGTTPPSDENAIFDKSVAGKRHDHRLWLETAWFLVVNAGVGYMFLYRGFEWSQERGVVQRFMW